MIENVKDLVYARLDEMGIAYRRERHARAHSIEECAAVEAQIGAVVCKNYFLTTKSRKHYCLCVVRPNVRFRTADVSKQAELPRLSFADEAAMEELLNVFPGAVSPMGLLFDPDCRVQLLVDSALPELEELAFHPCDNCETLAMKSEDFFGKFLPETGHSPKFVEIHDFLDENPTELKC